MSDRRVAYNAPDPCSESLEKMTKRLTIDLRSRIRRLSHVSPLTDEWCEMTDTLQHLASVAMMEEKDLVKKDGSIWERDELCVRYIIEEGKINLLLRTMIEYKLYQYTACQDSLWDDDTKMRMKVFEHSLGVLLRCCFSAVESLQTLDLTALLQHITSVLEHALNVPESVFYDCAVQEILVITYLHLLLRKIDQINEDLVLSQVVTNDIVSLSLKHYEKFSSQLEKGSKSAYVYFFAHLMETEAYQTNRKNFITNNDDKKRLQLLEGNTKELLSVDVQNRKALRALSDNIVRYK